MKKTTILSLILAIATISLFSSCQKTEQPVPVSIQTSEVIPVISTDSNYGLGLYTSYQGYSVDVNVDSNIPVYVTREQNDNSGPYTFGSSEKKFSDDSFYTGSGKYVFEILSGKRPDYTQDIKFCLSQNWWHLNSIIAYRNYGYVENEIVFRVIGKNGQRRIDFNNPDKNKPENDYYFNGEVIKIGNISEGKKEFTTFEPIKNNFYSSIGKVSWATNQDGVNGTYNTECVTVTLENEGVEIPITVYGSKRDNELQKFLNVFGDLNRTEGYVIQVPLRFKNLSDVKDRKFDSVRVNEIAIIRTGEQR